MGVTYPVRWVSYDLGVWMMIVHALCLYIPIAPNKQYALCYAYG